MTLLKDDSAQVKPDNPDQDKAAGDDQKVEVPGWLAKIEDKNLQDNPTLRRFKSEHELAVSYLAGREKYGDPASFVSVPDAKAPPEKWDEFFNKLGRPENPEKYALPEGMTQTDDPLGNEFRLEAHRLGITQAQYEGLNMWVSQVGGKHSEAETKAHNDRVAKSEEALRKEWSGEYDRNLAIANTALKRFGGADLAKVLREKGLDGDAAMVRFFANLGRATMEESELKGITGSRGPAPRSRAQLEEMMKDPRYWSDPEYRQTVENGFKALYPGQKPD